jgi:hypothetical protein
VRERTFYELDRRLSPAIKAALVEFVRALARIGRGTGKTAWMHRKTARNAMANCYGAVPCWIMPTWRVAEQLPADLGVLDLVIIDEASQSDVTELPVLLRGRKIFVVGDDRQVSPTAPFVTQEKINQLRHHYLGDAPFKSLLEPGESIFDLMRAVFPNQRLMLKEHFRCVEPIIQFSMQFYPEKMLPLRIPSAHERLDPPLIDIYVPHGARERNKKINPAEAEVIVDEIAALTKRREMRERTIGVISLVGKEQADYIRQRLSEAKRLCSGTQSSVATALPFKDRKEILSFSLWWPTRPTRLRLPCCVTSSGSTWLSRALAIALCWYVRSNARS